MATLWLFNAKTSSGHAPKVHSQVTGMKDKLQTLRNPWVADSVFMAKLYTAMIVATAIFVYPWTFDPDNSFEGAYTLLAMYVITLFIFAPFLAYRILYIKKLSNFYLNRSKKMIYYQRFSKLITFNWHEIHGGLFRRVEFGGSGYSTCYALAFAPARADGSLHQKNCLWIDSNEPTEPDIKHVAEAWEYLRHFMDHGPDKLPHATNPTGSTAHCTTSTLPQSKPGTTTPLGALASLAKCRARITGCCPSGQCCFHTICQSPFAGTLSAVCSTSRLQLRPLKPSKRHPYGNRRLRENNTVVGAHDYPKRSFYMAFASKATRQWLPRPPISATAPAPPLPRPTCRSTKSSP